MSWRSRALAAEAALREARAEVGLPNLAAIRERARDRAHDERLARGFRPLPREAIDAAAGALAERLGRGRAGYPQSYAGLMLEAALPYLAPEDVG